MPGIGVWKLRGKGVKCTHSIKVSHLLQVLDLPLWANYLTSSVTQFPHLQSEDNIYLVDCYETVK